MRILHLWIHLLLQESGFVIFCLGGGRDRLLVSYAVANMHDYVHEKIANFSVATASAKIICLDDTPTHHPWFKTTRSRACWVVCLITQADLIESASGNIDGVTKKKSLKVVALSSLQHPPTCFSTWCWLICKLCCGKPTGRVGRSFGISFHSCHRSGWPCSTRVDWCDSASVTVVNRARSAKNICCTHHTATALAKRGATICILKDKMLRQVSR